MDPQQPYRPVNPDPQRPEVYNSPTLADAPYGAQPTPQPVVSANTQPRGSKGPVIAAIIVVLIALVVVVAAVLLRDKDAKSPQQTSNTKTASQQAQILAPATSLELQQADNSLSQNLSGLDDEKDFPSNSLDDKTLGL